MIEKGIVDVGELKIRLFIDPCEPEYLQFVIYENDEKQTEFTDERANMILGQALELIQLREDNDH